MSMRPSEVPVALRAMLAGLLYRIQRLTRALLDREGWRAELDEELRFHEELEQMHQRHAGASDVEARHVARARLGSPMRVRERIADQAGVTAMDALTQDLRFGARALRRRPGFALAAAGTLALGIGASTAMFSAAHALLLRPLPFPTPEQLLTVSLTAPARGDQPARDAVVWSHPKFAAFRNAHARTHGTQPMFSHLALWSERPRIVQGPRDATRAAGELVTADYLPALDARPALGRDFRPEEDRRSGGPRVVLLGDALWRRHFGADPAVLGRPLRVDGAMYTVVGVLPPGFRGLSGRAELWTPVLALPADAVSDPWTHGYHLLARVAADVPVARAQAAVPPLGWQVDAARALDAERVDPAVRRALLVLVGAVGLVLLVACANVAALLLVRAAERRRELGVRLALGASRGRIVRQLLTEGVLLSTLGGVAGVAVAWVGVRVLAALDPAPVLRLDAPPVGLIDFGAIRLDGAALACAAGLALATGVLVSLVPALQATRPGRAEARWGDGGAGLARRHRSGRHWLVATQLVLATVLLTGSGLLLRSLGQLLDIPLGIEPAHVLTLRLDALTVAPVGVPPESAGVLTAAYDQARARVAALPGVTGAALGDCVPLDGGCNATVLARRDRPPVARGMEPEVGVHAVAPTWFGVLGVPLRRGRLLTDADRAGAPRVVLVSETAARMRWPGEDPIGRPVSLGIAGFWTDTATVVGVVGDVRYGRIESPATPDVYVALAQAPPPRVVVFARAARAPGALAGAARRAVREGAPGLVVDDVRTLDARVSDAVAPARFAALLLGAFAASALALAAVGTYGVVAFEATRRRREVAVRIALGAPRRAVVRLMMRRGLWIGVTGGGAGLLVALTTSSALRALLHGVTPADPATFAAAAAVLVGVTLVATWLPARRAAGVAPAEVLRDV
jgi:predicted permease